MPHAHYFTVLMPKCGVQHSTSAVVGRKSRLVENEDSDICVNVRAGSVLRFYSSNSASFNRRISMCATRYALWPSLTQDEHLPLPPLALRLSSLYVHPSSIHFYLNNNHNINNALGKDASPLYNSSLRSSYKTPPGLCCNAGICTISQKIRWGCQE
jgi:hypothetical protein